MRMVIRHIGLGPPTTSPAAIARVDNYWLFPGIATVDGMLRKEYCAAVSAQGPPNPEEVVSRARGPDGAEARRFREFACREVCAQDSTSRIGIAQLRVAVCDVTPLHGFTDTRG
jgi:hypothetical protein